MENKENSLSTRITYQDVLKSTTDKYGGMYSEDHKRFYHLRGLDIFNYKVEDGVEVICGDNYFRTSAFSLIIRNIELPESLIAIGHHAFSFCRSITKLVLPKSLRIIEGNPFIGCKNCKVIECLSPYYTVKNNILYSSDLKRLISCLDFTSSFIDIEDTVEYIGEEAFFGCYNIKGIKLSSNLKTIGESAFSSCINLESVKLPGKLTQIDNFAFSDCYALKDINLPASLIEISGNPFKKCYNCTIVNASNNFYVEDYFLYTSDMEGVISCLQKRESIKMSFNTKHIGDYCFSENEILKDVIFSPILTTIGKGAFRDCRSLNRIVMPPSIQIIEDEAFYGCHIKDLNLPISLKIIGKSAFAYSDFTELYISMSVTKICRYAFDECNHLKDIYIYNPDIDLEEEWVPFPFTHYSINNIYIPRGSKDRFVSILESHNSPYVDNLVEM